MILQGCQVIRANASVKLAQTFAQIRTNSGQFLDGRTRGVLSGCDRSLWVLCENVFPFWSRPVVGYRVAAVAGCCRRVVVFDAAQRWYRRARWEIGVKGCRFHIEPLVDSPGALALIEPACFCNGRTNQPDVYSRAVSISPIWRIAKGIGSI